MKKIALLLIPILLIVSGCANTRTSSRTHPTLTDELHQIDSVVVIPPDVEILLVTFTGENERITEKEIEIEEQLMEIARMQLLLAGYEVVDYDLKQRIAEDEELSQVVGEVKAGYEQAKKDLEHGKVLSAEKASAVQASVGEAVNLISAHSGADAILLIRYQGFEKSGGQVAKDIATSVLVGVLTAGAAVPVSQTSRAITEAALIDGTTGDVLWTDVRGGELSAKLTRQAMISMPDDVDPDPVAQEQQKKANMEEALGTADSIVLLGIAKSIYQYDEYSPELLDQITDRILLEQDTEDGTQADAVAWLCKVIEKSGDSRYRTALKNVSDTSKNSKIVRYASAAYDSLPDTEADQYLGAQMNSVEAVAH